MTDDELSAKLQAVLALSRAARRKQGLLTASLCPDYPWDHDPQDLREMVADYDEMRKAGLALMAEMKGRKATDSPSDA